MSTEDYQIALLQRGFAYYGRRHLWIGPNNINIRGELNWDDRPGADLERLKSIAVVDELLRKQP